MIKTIWKFDLQATDKQFIRMPLDAEILSVQSQQNSPKIWALVNPEEETEERCFEVFGTGHDIRVDMGVERKFLGTFQMYDGRMVFHVFERIN